MTAHLSALNPSSKSQPLQTINEPAEWLCSRFHTSSDGNGYLLKASCKPYFRVYGKEPRSSAQTDVGRQMLFSRVYVYCEGLPFDWKASCINVFSGAPLRWPLM